LLRTIATSDAFQRVHEAKQAGPSNAHEPTEEIVIDEELPTTTTVDTSTPATEIRVTELQAVASTGHEQKN
jgi:hypothetical protein